MVIFLEKKLAFLVFLAILVFASAMLAFSTFTAQQPPSTELGVSVNETVTGWLFYAASFVIILLLSLLLWYYYRVSDNLDRKFKGKAQKVYARIKPLALFNVLFSALVVGLIAHELVHILLIPNPTSITFHFADPEKLVSICCIKAGEHAFEELAYAVQFAVSLLWIFANYKILQQKPK